ncbi:hypothetical protein EYZ29_005054 [Escherichia coli]|nr:hypothetical protein [Escherichia coli]
MAARRGKFMGVACRNMGSLCVIDVLAYLPHLEIAVALVNVGHSEVVDIFKYETTTLSWRCTQQEYDAFVASQRKSVNTFGIGLQIRLRDDEYEKFPVAIDEILAKENISRGYARFLQAALEAIERYRDKHFPQGVNTPAKRGYRRKPSLPDPFSDRHGIHIFLEPISERWD